MVTDIVCPECGARWSGLQTAHCMASGCHKLFTSYHAFDAHRSGSHADGRHCLDPATAVNENPESSKFGQKLFRLTRRPYECWTTAGAMPKYWERHD